MVDDLVTKGADEPYRLLTSRAEYRLLLRQDNADLRLTDVGRRVGLVDDPRWERFQAKKRAIDEEIERLKTVYFLPVDSTRLAELGEAPIVNKISALDLMRRPNVTHSDIRTLEADSAAALPRDVVEQIDIQAKYSGYIDRQTEQVEAAAKREDFPIPAELDFKGIRSMSNEGREKLSSIRPVTLGQAARIPGVTPADIAMLTVFLEQRRRLAEPVASA